MRTPRFTRSESLPITPLRNSRPERPSPLPKRGAGEQSLLSNGPMCMLIVTVTLSVIVLFQMIVRDLNTTSVADCTKDKISKHLHCVGAKGASFSEFLWQQGARREHPLYVAATHRSGKGDGARHGAASRAAALGLDPAVFEGDNATEQWSWR